MKFESAAACPLLLGHRGLRRESCPGFRRQLPPENTCAAFEYALAHDCDGFEFDVRFTRDGHSVICHDAQLNNYDVSSIDWSDLVARNSESPCLEDVLVQFGNRAYLDIEVKVPGHEETIIAAVRATPPARGYILSSFFPNVLMRLRELDPALQLGFICESPEYVGFWKALPITTLILQQNLVSQPLLAEVHHRGLKVFAWTVNDGRDILRLANWGVDGLISDDPALLSHIFAERRLRK